MALGNGFVDKAKHNNKKVPCGGFEEHLFSKDFLSGALMVEYLEKNVLSLGCVCA